MKDISRRANFTTIEFWASITIFVFIIFFFVTIGLDSNAHVNARNKVYFDKAKVPFNYYQHYFFPRIIRHIFFFLSFLFLNFIVVPKLLKKEELVKNFLFIALVYVTIAAALGVTDTYLKGYLYATGKDHHATEQLIFWRSFLYAAWLLLVFGLYSVIKYVSLYLLQNAESIQAKYYWIAREVISAFVVWLVIMFLMLAGGAERLPIALWATVIPFGIALYSFQLTLSSQDLRKRKNHF
jgi:hypothetical protein